jgi:enterobactin synthetase component D
MSKDHGDAAYLQRRSSAFLTDITRRPLPRAEMVLLQCKYDVARFDIDLYGCLGVCFPEQLQSAVKSRRAEFLAGRALAQAALSILGIEDLHISFGDDRAPIWPFGTIGAISHSHGRCAILVSTYPKARVGIDIERLVEGDARAAILKTCISEDERRVIDRQRNYSVSQLATLIFSAKETLYKMLYPSVCAYFGFHAAAIQGMPIGNSLYLYLTQDLPGGFQAGTAFDIRFEFGLDYVLTWAKLDR